VKTIDIYISDRTVVDSIAQFSHFVCHALVEEAQTAGAILGHNYQSTEWYEDSYALLTGQGLEPRSIGDNWLSAIYRQMIRGEWL